jgi:hypothetical protein
VASSADAELLGDAGAVLSMKPVRILREWPDDGDSVTVVATAGFWNFTTGLPPGISGARMVRGDLLVRECAIEVPPIPLSKTDGLDVGGSPFDLALRHRACDRPGP